VVPKREKCLSVLEDEGVPEHIVKHSLMVEGIALFIAEGLLDAGVRLDKDLISAGAILHDISKMPAMEEGKYHGEMGSDLMIELGFAEVAPIVRQHVFLDDYENDSVSEAGLVNYADKRVNHDKIVTLDERFSYLFERYGVKSEEAKERIERLYRLTKVMEEKIFKRLPYGPNDLVDIMEREGKIGLHT
jgi:putative nucleotidyltransferase with HDIG domain